MDLSLLTEIDVKFWMKGRLESFTRWPFSSDDGTCTPERMAAAGFYCVGGDEDVDAVECFMCSKQLDGWDPTDDPWEEHVKHQNNCPFVRLNKQDESQWTIDDLFELVKLYYVKKCTRQVDEDVKKLKLRSQVIISQIPKIYRQERKSRKGGK